MAEKFLPSRNVMSGNWFSNSTWLKVTPKKIADEFWQSHKTLKVDDPDEDLPTYYFLFPNEFTENIVHTWEPMNNIMAQLAEKWKSAKYLIYGQGTKVGKVDTPLIYKDSQRRQIQMMVSLAFIGEGTAYSEVVEPVKNLMKWSSPQLGGENTTDVSLSLPYIFQLETIRGESGPNNIIKIRAAALQSVQPTYQMPYIDGYPSKCDLTLNFIDVNPLNRAESFNKNIEQT